MSFDLEREYLNAVAVAARIAGQRDEMMAAALAWKEHAELYAGCLIAAMQALQMAAPSSVEATMALALVQIRLEAARDAKQP